MRLTAPNKFRLSAALCISLALLLPHLSIELHAQSALGDIASGGVKDFDASADSCEYVGDNIIAKGHAVIRYKDMQITADKAIGNTITKDIEAVGNVTFYRRSIETRKIDYWEYEDLLDDPTVSVQIERYITTPTGRQMIEATIVSNDVYLMADRAVGNLSSGVVQFKNLKAHTGDIFCKAAIAERSPDGSIMVRDATLSSCEYLMDDHEHYSIHASKAKLTPRGESNKNLLNYSSDQGEYSVWAYNTTFRIGDLPVFWVPALYKPPDSDSFGIESKFGHTTEWGYFGRLSKRFQLLNDPSLKTKIMADYYSKRGFGYGADTQFAIPESRTELFTYNIHDRSPYGGWEDDSDKKDDNGLDTPAWMERNARLKTPERRYDIKLTNLTHITPRLDFRGQIEKISDINFLKDFFTDRYDSNPQPPTYADLEYQFDRASVAVLTTPRINNFDTVVNRLPEVRLDIPRQELFSNIYYQGENSFDYLVMKWRKYDADRTLGNLIDPADYNTSRFDSLHMFYYPLNLDWINIIPRAGLRMTAYSRTSKRSIGFDELSNLFLADTIDGQPTVNVTNYDGNGGAKFRVVGEFGLEANTKIYQSWQNVKNSFWELDGLRHVAVPYINYNYIPDPTVSRDHLMYFDDIDRITAQNFIRLGLKNRLQTRRGDYGNEEIYEWLSMENYFDFHFKNEEGFKHVGDLGTILKFSPFANLSLTSELLLDLGQSNSHDTEVVRGDRTAGRPGVSWKYINKWTNGITYEIAKDWKIYANYNYQDAYRQRSIYSMGSTLTQINSSSSFEMAYGQSQVFTGGFEFPIIDSKTKGSIEADYDVDAALMRRIGAKIIRKLHCWELAIEAGREMKRSSNYDKVHSHYVMMSLYLSAMPSMELSAKQGSSSEGN